MIHHPAILCTKLAAAMLLAIILVVLHQILPADQFRLMVILSVIAFVAFCVLFWIVIVKCLADPHSWLSRHVTLWQEPHADNLQSPLHDELASLVGTRGHAITPLRPAGTARFGEKNISVIADGQFIESGHEVEVVHAEGARVVVHVPSSRLSL